MPLVKNLCLLLGKSLPLLILLGWISFQFKGYYWILLVLATLTLPRFKQSLIASVFTTRQYFLAVLLAIFSSALLISAFVDSGLRGVLPEIPLSLPILPLFLISCIISSPRSDVSLQLPSLASCFFFPAYALVIDSIIRGFQLADLPASSLRPLELQGSSALFLSASLTISMSSCCAANEPTNKRILYSSLLSLLLSLIVFALFRGVTASCAVLMSSLVASLLWIKLPNFRSQRFSFAFLALFAALLLSIMVDLRFFILKYLLAPFISTDMTNGRHDIFSSWLVLFGASPPVFFGSQPGVPYDFFAHNLIVDSLIKDGLLAASSLLLFLVVTFTYLLIDFIHVPSRYSFLNLTLFILLTIPALLQPVQFSHAFAFLLSIASVGILTSMSVHQPPFTPCPMDES